MKPLEHKFFHAIKRESDYGSQSVREISCSLNSWSTNQFLLPLVEEGQFAWVVKERTFHIGSREAYISWLNEQGELPCLYEGEYPLGIYCCRLGGRIRFNHALLNTSYCASWTDFMPLRWALEGFPEVDADKYGDLVPWDVILEEVHYEGVYKTYTKTFKLPMPRHFDDEQERHKEENNFFQRFLQRI